jgi:hypothetical protein
MTTEKQSWSEEELLAQASEELAQVAIRMRPRFRRAEARKRAERYLQALLSPVERKNGGSYTALVKKDMVADAFLLTDAQKRLQRIQHPLT